MLDLHCHILPGLDDGPATVGEALKMAAVAVAGGISEVVATPHSGNGVYMQGPEEIRKEVANLRRALRQAGIPLEVHAGAEERLVPGLAEKLIAGGAVTINGGRYLLLELPEVMPIELCKQELFNLRMGGIVPVIAHPERQPYFLKRPRGMAELLEMGCLCQLTAGSLLGDFGAGVRKCAEELVRSRMVQVLASDAHSSINRAPLLGEAVNRASRLLGSRHEAEQLVMAHPRAIVANREIRIKSPVPETGWLRRRFAGLFEHGHSPAA